MQTRFLLIPLLLISAVSCTSKHGLKIIIVNKHGLFEDAVQKSSESALKWFENAVLVEDFASTTKFSGRRSHITGYDSSVNRVTIQTPNKLFSLDVNSPEFEKVFDEADHVVFIEDKKNCGLLPSATTTSGRQSGEKIPKFSIIEWCYHKQVSKFSYFDLFRHEIMHALGYGTESKILASTKTEKYDWKGEDGVVVPATRYSIEFNEKVMEQARKHFGCPDMTSIEMDEGGIHLNEYIFHNEVMTPTINSGRNFFSWISVEILEETYSPEQVYFVNREFVASEADSYKYAKGFGCTYLFKSCYDFFDELKSEGKPRPGPFCPEYEPNSKTAKCFVVGQRMTLFQCISKQPSTENADNGIEPLKTSQFQDAISRFCPIYHFYDQFSMYPLADCAAKNN